MQRQIGQKDRTAGSAATLPPMPNAFWQVADACLSAWKGLEALLSEEWEALRVRDLTRLWQVAEKKKGQVDVILKSESRLVNIVDRILARCERPSGALRWGTLRKVVHQKDVAPLEAWKASRELSRRRVLAVNERHRQWMEDQAKVVRELGGIVSGQRHSMDGLYGPGALRGASTERPASRCTDARSSGRVV